MAFTIRGMKIRNQILLVTLPPLFVLLCAVGLAFYAYRSVINAERSASQSKESVVRLESFLQHATEAYMHVRGYASNHRNESLAYYDKAVADGLTDVNALNDLEAADPGRAEEVTRIRAEFDLMQKQWALPTIEKVRSGEQLDANATMLDGQTRYSSIRTKVLKLQKENEGQNQDEISGAEKVIRRMLVVGVSLAVLLAGILVFLTGVVTRLIVAPVLQLVRASEQVGRGDFAPVSAPRGQQRIWCPFPQLFPDDHRPAARAGGNGLLELGFPRRSPSAPRKWRFTTCFCIP